MLPAGFGLPPGYRLGVESGSIPSSSVLPWPSPPIGPEEGIKSWQASAYEPMAGRSGRNALIADQGGKSYVSAQIIEHRGGVSSLARSLSRLKSSLLCIAHKLRSSGVHFVFLKPIWVACSLKHLLQIMIEYFLIRPSWLVQQRQARESFPYFLGWARSWWGIFLSTFFINNSNSATTR